MFYLYLAYAATATASATYILATDREYPQQGSERKQRILICLTCNVVWLLLIPAAFYYHKTPLGEWLPIQSFVVFTFLLTASICFAPLILAVRTLFIPLCQSVVMVQ